MYCTYTCTCTWLPTACMCMHVHTYVPIYCMWVSEFSPLQADKVVQLYETMLTRHTCMVVGPTGGGKSVVINTLAQSQTRYILYVMHVCTYVYVHVCRVFELEIGYVLCALWIHVHVHVRDKIPLQYKQAYMYMYTTSHAWHMLVHACTYTLTCTYIFPA